MRIALGLCTIPNAGAMPRKHPTNARAKPQRRAPADSPAARLADLLESRLLPALERIAAALENGGIRPLGHSMDAAVEPAAAVRRAIEIEDWRMAQTLLVELAALEPDSAEIQLLTVRVEAGRRGAADRLRARLAAAREANDPMGALELRDELARLTPPADHQELDRDLARWLMLALQRRLRAGTAGVDVAELAARAAASLAETPEGASLRAALPTLRRSAGLCPRCAQPYTGIANACPSCLRQPPASQPSSNSSEDPPQLPVAAT